MQSLRSLYRRTLEALDGSRVREGGFRHVGPRTRRRSFRLTPERGQADLLQSQSWPRSMSINNVLVKIRDANVGYQVGEKRGSQGPYRK